MSSVFRDSANEAERLFEESAANALRALENSWAGLLDFWVTERGEHQLEKALRLAALAEQLFPESARILNAVDKAREKAARLGLPRKEQR